MSNLSEMQKIYQSTGEGLVRDIADAQGVDCDFVVSVSPINNEYAIVIEAASVPLLTLDSGLIHNAIFNDDEKERKRLKKKIRRDISLAMTKLPKMRRTLSLVPLAEAIALSTEAKRFVKTAFPERVIFKIPDGHLDIQVTVNVTIREITTNQSVSLSGTNETVLRQQCLAQLTQLVAMDEYLRAQIDREKYNKEAEEPPKKVFINTDERGTEVKYEY